MILGECATFKVSIARVGAKYLAPLIQIKNHTFFVFLGEGGIQ